MFFEQFKDLDEMKVVLDEINNKMLKIRNGLIEMLDSKEMEWIDIYRKNRFKTSSPKVSKWPIFCFLFGAIFCLSCSTIFHLFCCHNEKLFHVLNQIDYAGISILIASSCYPPFVYMFYCSSFFSIFYISLITIFSVIVFICSLIYDFNSPQRRTLKGTLFLCLGLSTAIPFIHIIFFKHYTPGIIQNPVLINWILGGISYIFGVFIYMWRFPEKYWPGKFDFIGQSHNIFHVNVLIGIGFHYLASLNSYHDRLDNVCY